MDSRRYRSCDELTEQWSALNDQDNRAADHQEPARIIEDLFNSLTVESQEE
ncbi:MAG: hypothetical protein HQ581_06660 [Planctomycetes bacterium]|nr:hypothetical protein [Planctomycetota bacterium]